jgi:hypothetical protein
MSHEDLCENFATWGFVALPRHLPSGNDDTPFHLGNSFLQLFFRQLLCCHVLDRLSIENVVFVLGTQPFQTGLACVKRLDLGLGELADDRF